MSVVDPNAYFAALGAVALGGYLVASSFTQLVNRQEEYLQVIACASESLLTLVSSRNGVRQEPSLYRPWAHSCSTY